MPRVDKPPEPWRSFLAEVDSLLIEDTQLHLCVVPNVGGRLIEIGSKGSALHKKHRVHLDARHGRNAA